MFALVELRNVAKAYFLGSTRIQALRSVDVSVESGEFVAVLGASGSGKTTLLNLVGCVDVPSAGTVRIDGDLTLSMTDRELTRTRRQKIGFIFQSFNLVPVFNVHQNIEVPLLLGGSMSSGQRRARVRELIERVGLELHAKHRPAELSGGQRQRVAIARALVHRPKLVLADEPTANLDSVTGESVLQLMLELQRSESTTFMVATHDAALLRHAGRVLRVHDGRLESDTRHPPSASHM